MAKDVLLPYVCARCAGRLLRNRTNTPYSINGQWRKYHSTQSNANDSSNPEDENGPTRNKSSPTCSSSPQPGPMSRRLEEATEEALLTGGTAGRRAVEDAGFSDELKERLLAKVQDAQFRSEHAGAFAEAGVTGMPTSAGQGTRLTATSEAWTGTETTEDAVLRMLDDAHKPLRRELRGKLQLPDLQPVDTRLRREPKMTPGRKAASARDKASMYSGLGLGRELDDRTKQAETNGLGEEEREALRQEFRERFRPAARAMPTTLVGLASLANERIEDAIARGQFKNIPRGAGVERDTRSDNPFVDTTEYIMNKMIKRQDIVPPWIEKQQELVKTAHGFRTRLRNDWKRHAARMIASEGGSLEVQIERARRYARAEERRNPRRRDVDQIVVPTSATDDPVMVKVREQRETVLVAAAAAATGDGGEQSSAAAAAGETGTGNETGTPMREKQEEGPLPAPYRDPTWLKTEQAYMELSISNLNALTRSYNLMAPELAKKPYFSLERELNNCYADVAPQLADVIKERATRPTKTVLETLENRQGSVFDRFGGGHKATVYDSKRPHYGFREMWRDWFSNLRS